MRDEHFRGYVDYQPDYDKVIDMIIALNPAAATHPDGAEEFATVCVHDSINQVLFGNAGAWSSTGGCIAVRVTHARGKKVSLAYNGPFQARKQ